MAFNIFFDVVDNPEDLFGSIPWQCEKCYARDKALLKITVDYDYLVLCKKCLNKAKKMILNHEKEIKNGKDTSDN